MASLRCVSRSTLTSAMCMWARPHGEHQPSDWFIVDEGSVRHDFHPGLHLFGRVGAEIICPHVGVRGLVVSGETGEILTSGDKQEGAGGRDRQRERGGDERGL